MSPAHNVVRLSRRSRKASFDDVHFSAVVDKSSPFEQRSGGDIGFHKRRELSMGGLNAGYMEDNGEQIQEEGEEQDNLTFAPTSEM